MCVFSDLIFYLDLIDPPLAGGNFTWLNGRVWSRLDRFFISASRKACFPDLIQKRLPRIFSEYHPILLNCGGINEGQGYSKFENVVGQ